MSSENESFFPGREDMDLSTPHGLAQARLDEMFEVALTTKARVTYTGPIKVRGLNAETEAYFAQRDKIKQQINPKLYGVVRGSK